MSAEKPWESGPFSGWVIEELNNRVAGISSGINQTVTDDSIVYKSGPRRHWIRAFSSGFVEGLDTDNNWGLILKSPDATYNVTTLDTFSARYGISQQQIYGYSNDETPKLIPTNEYKINVPEPGITSFTADVQKNFYITAKLNWICHSIDQLNAITPYFLNPLTTVFVEWGWNIFNRESLIDYRNENKLKEIVDNHFLHYQQGVPKSKGNYEFMVGEISNFEYSIEDNIIRGFTEIRSRQMSWSGFGIRGSRNINVKQTSSDGKSEGPALAFKTVCDQILTGLQYKSENIDPNSPPPAPYQVQLVDDEASAQVRDASIGPTAQQVDSISKLKNILGVGIYQKKYGADLENLSSYIYKYITDTKSQSQGGQTDLQSTYITFELFADIMNALKDEYASSAALKYYTIDVDSIVGYHKNLISTSKNVLIPNPSAPKFNGKGSFTYAKYADNDTKFIDDVAEENVPGSNGVFAGIIDTMIENSALVKAGIINVNTGPVKERERGQDKKVAMIEEESGNATVNEPGIGPNSRLKLLVGYSSGKIYRNNLDFVLNYYGRKKTRELSAFGMIETRSDEYLARNPNVKTNTPNIKNVYINLNFIRDSIVINNNIIDLEGVYNSIIKELNDSVCDFWNLELINVDSDGTNSGKKNRLKVIDQKNVKSANRSTGYLFEYGNSNCIIKKINFTTTLTNAQANQILYRSFGSTSLSTNNLIDFTNNKKFRDKLKSIEKNENKTAPSNTILTFMNVVEKYLKFDENNPNGNFLMRVKVLGTKQQKSDNSRSVSSSETTTIDKKKYNIVDLCIPDKEALVYLLNDGDVKNNTNVYCAPIRNVEIEVALMGIAGIRVFEYFQIKNLPPPFTEKVVVFQVRDVYHTVDENGWETRIKASLRPAYNLNV